MSYYKYNYCAGIEQSNIDLKLYYCGTEGCKPNHAWGPAVKDHYKFHYIHSGKGILQIGKDTYPLTKGQGFLIWPHTVSYYKADAEDPWTYSWVAFNGLNAESYLRRANLTLDAPVYQCYDEEALQKLFIDMLEASKKEQNRDIHLLNSLYAFLAHLMDETFSAHSYDRKGKPGDLYIKKAVDFIETNYSRQVSIAEIAEYVGLNRKYFSKLFAGILNTSPQNFLIQFRLNKACELMENPNLSLVEISNSVGYNDPLLFSRIFKKAKGMAPKYYRRKVLQLSTPEVSSPA